MPVNYGQDFVFGLSKAFIAQFQIKKEIQHGERLLFSRSVLLVCWFLFLA